MMEECPLLKRECIREGCAWWNERDRECSVKTIASCLRGTIEVLVREG